MLPRASSVRPLLSKPMQPVNVVAWTSLFRHKGGPWHGTRLHRCSASLPTPECWSTCVLSSRHAVMARKHPPHVS